MTTQQSKSVAQRTFDALNQRDLDGVVAYYASNCRFYGWGPQPLDVKGYKAAMAELLAAFPDSRFSIDDVIAEGDRVAVRHSMQGTHRGEFQGVPATGKQVRANAIVIYRLENGAAAELWLSADFMGLMQQLGVVPTPASP